MNALGDPPPGLRTTSDLDGLHVELSAYPYVLRENTRATARTAALLGGGLATLGFYVVGLGLLAMFSGLATAGAWTFLDDARLPGKVSQFVVLGPQHLHVHGPNLDARIPWVDVGRVTVVGNIEPVLVVRVQSQPDLRIPMEHEPHEHARWLADLFATRSRERREGAGSAKDVPQALKVEL